MSPSPQMKTVEFEGVRHQFPADASDDEIRQALESGSKPKSPQDIISAIPRGTKLSDMAPSQFSKNFGTFKQGLRDVRSGQVGHGIHEMISGAASEAATGALPFMAANPFATAAGFGTGLPAGAAAKGISRGLGASEGASEAIGDVAGLTAGSFGTQISPPGLPSRAGIGGFLRGAWQAAKDIPFIGKLLRIPEGAAKGYREAVGPKIQPKYEPYPDRPKGGLARPAGFESGMPRRVPRRSGLPRVAGEQQPGGPRQVTIQHLGDMRINGRTPPPPKMYDSFGREIKP